VAAAKGRFHAVVFVFKSHVGSVSHFAFYLGKEDPIFSYPFVTPVI
jgi:hypothetical protein